MNTYTVLFAEDVPHYGVAEIEAESDAAALDVARAYDISQVTNDAVWENSACKRIVWIEDPEGNTVAEEVALDDCFLRYGGEKDRLLCDAASEMFAALALCEDMLSQLAPLCDLFRHAGEEPSVSTLTTVRAAIAKAKGGSQ